MEVDYLFQIGDNIVYPMQGAGIIKAMKRRKSQEKNNSIML